MRETLELLREMGVKSAKLTGNGSLLEVEFWPAEFELPVSDRTTLLPVGDDIPAPYRMAARAVQGLKLDGDS